MINCESVSTLPSSTRIVLETNLFVQMVDSSDGLLEISL